MARLGSTLIAALVAYGCREPAPGVSRRFDALPRAEVNRRALHANLPLFWVADGDGDRAIDPDEVATLLFYPDAPRWAEGGAFTPAFEAAWDRLVSLEPKRPAASEPERHRRALVARDLDQGVPTLVLTDLHALSPSESRFVGLMLEVARRIDSLYDVQTGAAALAAQLPAGDDASASLFRRNRGPKCRGPATEGDPLCSALPGAPRPRVDIYPAELQERGDFCQALDLRPDAERLFSPFSVVRSQGGELIAVPYSAAYVEHMTPIATELRRAAEALDPGTEPALIAYLRAAAAGFESNDWLPADEAWSRMNAENSKWYLRVGPDETAWDPCARKAGFHLTLARINRTSLAWQAKLSPLRQEMEAAVAQAAGAPYRAREVTFHLPDFIDIVVNAGDDREPIGATVGQSLPNWGPVAIEGRGRTVAMTNLYTDPDSQARLRARAASLLDSASLALVGEGVEAGLLGTILHEATHNLGPVTEYRIGGRPPGAIFGGRVAGVLEELKAQTGALFLIETSQQRGAVDERLATNCYLDSILWSFGQIAEGMYTATGERKNYAQLSAVQIGLLLEDGAMRWDSAAKAANGKDTGAFTVDRARLAPAAAAMMERVAGILARGERKQAEELLTKFVDGPAVPQAVIAERIRRFPEPSFVYAVTK